MVLHKNLLGDDLHVPKDHTHVEADITDLDHVDSDAIHTNVADEIHTALPIALIALDDTDSFLIEQDDGGTWAKARLQWNTIKSELEDQLGGPWLPLTAGSGEQISGELHLQDHLMMDADKKIYGGSGHDLAFYQSADDSNNFGNINDVCRLKGSAVRPVYQKVAGVDVQLALYSDIGAGGGAAVLRDGSLGLTADWDAGVYTITTENLEINDTISVNTIDELSAGVGVTIDGVLLKDSIVTTDQIDELTPAAGVTIDGLQIKDGDLINASGFSLYYGATEIAQINSDHFNVTEDLKVDAAKALYVNLIDTNGAVDLVLYRNGTPKITIDANYIQFDTGPARFNGGLGPDVQVYDGTGYAGAVYMNGADAMEFCDTDHECHLKGSEYRPQYQADGELDKDVALVEDITTATYLPIFVANGTWNDGGGAAPDEEYINWTGEIRKDAGYTHDTGTNPDEITLEDEHWYEIQVDVGFSIDPSDTAGEAFFQVEFWDGGGWDEEVWADLYVSFDPALSLYACGHITFVKYFDTDETKVRIVANKTVAGSYDISGINTLNRIMIRRLPDEA